MNVMYLYNNKEKPFDDPKIRDLIWNFSNLMNKSFKAKSGEIKAFANYMPTLTINNEREFLTSEFNYSKNNPEEPGSLQVKCARNYKEAMLGFILLINTFYSKSKNVEDTHSFALGIAKGVFSNFKDDNVLYKKSLTNISQLTDRTRINLDDDLYISLKKIKNPIDRTINESEKPIIPFPMFSENGKVKTKLIKGKLAFEQEYLTETQFNKLIEKLSATRNLEVYSSLGENSYLKGALLQNSIISDIIKNINEYTKLDYLKYNEQLPKQDDEKYNNLAILMQFYATQLLKCDLGYETKSLKPNIVKQSETISNIPVQKSPTNELSPKEHFELIDNICKNALELARKPMIEKGKSLKIANIDSVLDKLNNKIFKNEITQTKEK